MRRDLGFALAALVLLAVYVAATLFPFHPLRWSFPRPVSNGAELARDGGIAFPAPGIARSDRPPGWLPDALRAQRLEMALRLRSFAPDQDGPARILTLSAGTRQRNLTLGQDGADLVLRLRTPATGRNGIYPDGRPVARIEGVFATAAWRDLALAIAPGELRIAVDGELRARAALPAAPLRGWNPGYRLALGNELTHDRPWLGAIRRAVVGTGGVAVDYARAGVLEVPPRFWRAIGPATLVPFAEHDVRDAALNFVGYVPLGLVLGAWRRDRSCAARLAWPTGLVLLLSATFETLQFALPERHPSITDLLLNTLGGALGALLVLWWTRRGSRRAQEAG